MASTLKINTLTGVSTAGSIAVTGEGNSTTTNLQQGLAKAWVNFDGTASGAAARDSFNVSGMTDNGTGDHTIAISNDMANNDYSSTFGGEHDASEHFAWGCVDHDNSGMATGSLRMNNGSNGGSKTDIEFASATIHGDLA